MHQKEEVLRESKTKLATMDSVKAQIDGLMKVRPLTLPCGRGTHLGCFLPHCRMPWTFRRK